MTAAFGVDLAHLHAVTARIGGLVLFFARLLPGPPYAGPSRGLYGPQCPIHTLKVNGALDWLLTRL